MASGLGYTTDRSDRGRERGLEKRTPMGMALSKRRVIWERGG